MIWNRHIELYSELGYLPNGAKALARGSTSIITHEGWQFDNIQCKFKGEIREYQLEAIMHIYENEGGLIELKTGGGKSFIQMGLVSTFKRKTLIIVPSKKLVSEMLEKFSEFTESNVGCFYSDKKDIKDITITTHMSFCKEHGNRFRGLGKYDLVIVDEADDKLSKKFINAICECDCNVLVGLTGTPKRQDLNRNDLQLFYGQHISVGGYQETPDNITHYIYNRTGDEKQMVDYYGWHTIRESIMENKYREITIVNKIKELVIDSFLTLILMDRITEINTFKEYFPKAVIITGKTKIKDDDMEIEKIRKSGGVIIGSRQKMYRGVDIQEIDHVIVASPVKFENNVIQSIGRGLRTFDGKGEIKISIINDTILRSQMSQQSKACVSEYGITPDKTYLHYKKT